MYWVRTRHSSLLAAKLEMMDAFHTVMNQGSLPQYLQRVKIKMSDMILDLHADMMRGSENYF